ncbi:MAG TPA: class I SAM-dependent methyltransferase [Chitinophagaceae bacterium]|nr:class I SAM-dependent methyltransferase [Chitinophagaceae bacterium]
MNNIHYTACPVCQSASLKEVFRLKDHSVTGEIFPVVECENCSLRITQDAPGENDIAPYYSSEDYISHTNTKRGLINRLYQSVRKKTLRKKSRLVKRVTGLKTGRLLDLGAGTGSFVLEMQRNSWDVTGIEPGAGAREVAKQNGIELGGPGKFFVLPKASFDAITLWHVLEHIHDLQKTVRHLKELLNEKGKLIIAVPNYTSKDAGIYKTNWAAYDVPRHLYHFSPASMQKLLEGNGLKLIGVKPMWYDSYYISLLSSKYKHGKTKYISAVWNGFRSNLKTICNSGKCSSIIYIAGK